MKDPRLARLAEILIDHSCKLQKGDFVLIEAFDLPDAALVCKLIELAAARGAHPLVSWRNNTVLRTLYRHSTETNLG
ncbi:MAG: aminopeptidase, partial [Planctomycetia bacterium]|nr:aminopeptidase [Planctomycetia bacterium]